MLFSFIVIEPHFIRISTHQLSNCPQAIYSYCMVAGQFLQSTLLERGAHNIFSIFPYLRPKDKMFGTALLQAGRIEGLRMLKEPGTSP